MSTFELALVTPAFLAGSAQGEADCDLRGATLRGQLRWWWRTMHTGHLDPTTLRRLEAAVWGSSSQGSAIRLNLQSGNNALPRQFDFKTSNENSNFLGRNGIQIENRPKTVQGIYYCSFGTGQERHQGQERPARWFRQPGSTWRLRIGARPTYAAPAADAKPVPIPARDVARQAAAALFLLTRYGGVGAKGRKGFGSLADTPIEGIGSIEDCRLLAGEFRNLSGIGNTPPAQCRAAPSLELMSTPLIVPTRWTNAWFALNRIGEAMQDFAKTGKHQLWKSALGIPRRSDHREAIGGNLKPTIQIPNFKEGTLTRHAAPIHYHVARSGGTLEVRLVTFLSPHLPDEETSKRRLGELRSAIANRIQERADIGGTAGLFPEIPASTPPAADGTPRVGGRVRAELVEEKTKHGGWKAKDLTSGQVRAIQNTARVPSDKKAGDIVELEVPNNAEFKWPVSKPPVPVPPPRYGGPRGRR
jgi:CRISPR-associated protein Cmr6